MAVVTITILHLISAGRPDSAGWIPILSTSVLWGAAVFVISWPLSAILRRGFHPMLAWLEAGLFWAAPIIWVIKLLSVEIAYPIGG